MSESLFPPRPEGHPKIYVYEDRTYQGCVKVGYTTKKVKDRLKDIYNIKTPSQPYKIIHEEPAMREDGSSFTDHDVHKVLRNDNILNVVGEWFECNLKQVKQAILAVKNRETKSSKHYLDFKMRPEQEDAVNKTMSYFKDYQDREKKTPHFLWNAKMRFGKTFASYQLAKKMKWKRILILTFKPAVQNAWQEDLENHKDFKEWQFITKENMSFEEIDKPIVCFGSFQDYLGKNTEGGIKPKNKWVHRTNWDCVMLDEYHFGAWRESAKDLFEAEDKKELKKVEGEALDYFNEDNMPITTKAYLYLSGTPFKAIESGEFIEEQIYNWTYADEQKAKEEWEGEDNPYLSLPRMVLLTYQLPEDVINIAKEGEFDEFDLNEFFKAEGEGETAKFKYENEVQQWLNFIRGSGAKTRKDNLKLGNSKKPKLPFHDTVLLDVLSHTFWFLPRVNSCFAMRNLFKEKQNSFFHDYKIIIAAGNEAGLGVKALNPVKNAMIAPLKSKTITLSCGKLTTGVSVKPWTGIFMLRNLSSPESYFQAAFRVQTPWTMPMQDKSNQTEVIKKVCYVFDFAPNRALKQVADYSCRLNIGESNPENKVNEFIKFLPILAYDGTSLKELDATNILDMAMSGTSATLLAKRWESALLVNVDNSILEKLMNNDQAMQALMNIEGFRSLNKDIETIISHSANIKKLKETANEEDLTKKDKKLLTDAEKEYKSLRKQIQEKLIKFATRIPIFMYLTDYREEKLKDIITQLDTNLFKKVTGLDLKDFELLRSIGVFNSSLMNDAVYKFKRYEDQSLNYTGLAKHKNLKIGLYDTALNSNELA